MWYSKIRKIYLYKEQDMEEKLKITRLFDLSKTIASPLFVGKTYPWEILPEISDFILSLGEYLPKDKFTSPQKGIWIANSAKVAPSALICAPCIIDEDAEVRHCAYIRGSAVVGKGAVVGNSCELKNCILFDGAQIPHFNYVGDSVVGYLSHMGAGAITSNVKSDKTLVQIKVNGKIIDTVRKKVGAFLGDEVEVGCNSVLNPGTVIGRGSRIYPLSCVRGYVPADSIYKASGEIVLKEI